MDEEPPLYPEFKIILFTSEESVPPVRKDASVQALGTLTCRSIIPFDELKIVVTDFEEENVAYREMIITLEMTSQGASAEFAAYMNGRRIASQNILVQLEGSGSQGAPSRERSTRAPQQAPAFGSQGAVPQTLPMRARSTSSNHSYSASGSRLNVTQSGSRSPSPGTSPPLPSNNRFGQWEPGPPRELHQTRSIRNLFSSKNK